MTTPLPIRIPTVGDIGAVLGTEDISRDVAPLSSIEVADDGASFNAVTDNGDRLNFALDSEIERSMSKFLGVPANYLEKCPGSLKAANLNHWIKESDEARALIIHNAESASSFLDPDKHAILPSDVAGVISRVFAPEDQLVTVHRTDEMLHIDVKVLSSEVDVPGNGVGDRPHPDGTLLVPEVDELTDLGFDGRRESNVFDITNGGVQFLIKPNQPPVVNRYFNRLVCDNGLVIPVEDAKITLRGKTVDDVIDEMESSAEILLGSMDQALTRYAETSEQSVPGNVGDFIRQVGLEHRIPNRIIMQALNYAGAYGMTRRDDITGYDVLNVFTNLANRVSYSSRMKLQGLGGTIADAGEEFYARCVSCERPFGGSHDH